MRENSEHFVSNIDKKCILGQISINQNSMNGKKSLLIYVVEDNQAYNRMVCEYLKKQNYTNVKSFISGNECIKTVMSGDEPDIVIQDYFLDDLNGIDVLKAIKAKCKDAEFIFLTSNENIEVAIECITYGVHDYIIKDKGDILKRLTDKVNKVSKVIVLRRKNKIIWLAIIIALLVLSLIIISGFLLYIFGIVVKS
jgi:response regulator RpfG family c-di-GMP phosphodiesterase